MHRSGCDTFRMTGLMIGPRTFTAGEISEAYPYCFWCGPMCHTMAGNSPLIRMPHLTRRTLVTKIRVVGPLRGTFKTYLAPSWD